MRSSNIAAFVVFGLAILHSTGGRSDGPCADYKFGTCLRGAASLAYARDSNRCVPDVLKQFDALKDHGEILGFWGGGAKISYPSLDDSKQHWQGIQRLAYPPNHRSLMVMTGSSYAGGNYAVVSLGTRSMGGFTGRRFGGNRMNDSTQDWNVPPPGSDRIVQKGITSESKTFNHPGSIQLLGQFLAIPLEVIGSGGPVGRTELFDAGVDIDFPHKPLCNKKIYGCMQVRWVFEHSKSGDGEVALAKLDDGRTLMINAITTDTKVLEINVSGLDADGKLLDISSSDPNPFGKSNSPGSGGKTSAIFEMSGLGSDWKDYQSLQLVTECGSGLLFLVAIGDGSSGDDYVDLHRLNFVVADTFFHRKRESNSEGEPVIISSVKNSFQRVRRKHFWCTYRGSDRQCDFAAASGIYVDPFGTLILYAAVHHNTGPGDHGTRFVEFSPNDPVDRPDTMDDVERCDGPAKMWVELSNNPLAEDGVPSAGSDRFFIEYQNETRSRSSFSKAYDFNDRARSIRYCLPDGYRYKLCPENDFKGMCTQVCGTYGEGCSGELSNGYARGLNLPRPVGRSGCFTAPGSSTCK